MPPPFKVTLLPHDPRWKDEAFAEGATLVQTVGPTLLKVHHVGSTSIPGLRAKPVLDIIPVFSDISAMDQHKHDVMTLGYEWWGELGLPERRYCTKSDPDTGQRLIQLHCYVEGSPEIDRHLAFRDYLCAHPEIASQYDEEKARCQRLHPNDSHAYGDCKSAWVSRFEEQALAWYRNEPTERPFYNY